MSADLLPVERAAQGLHAAELELWQAISSAVTPGSGRIITFTAPHAEAGTTSLAACTAAGLARHLQLRIAIVEANLERPFLASACGLDERPGLSEVLLGAVPLETALQRPDDLPSLTVLGGGAPRRVGSGEFAGEGLTRVLDQLRGSHDAVLIDAPPAMVEPGVLALVRASHAAVAVSRARVSTKGGIVDLQALVERAGTEFLGVVLNRWRPELSKGIG